MSDHPDNIRLVNAGAGSGKTYRITEEISRAIIDEQVEPGRIIATTFTRRAACELQSRIAARLTDRGRLAEARSVGSAMIGTVHSVCGRLLRRYCYEAGISPELDVLSEAESKILISRIIGEAATSRDVSQLRRLSDSFGYNDIGRTGDVSHDWHEDVRSIIGFARSNNLTPRDIRDHAELSVEEMVTMLPPANLDYRDFEESLAEEIEQALSLIPPGDTTKDTASAKALLSRLAGRIRHGRTVSWKDISKLCSLKTGAKSRDAVEALQSRASAYERTREYHKDIADYLRTVSRIAADTLELFARRKRETGVMDFVDQEGGLLDALQNAAVQARLRDEFSLLVVDEFQDTSPVQLAIFMKIAELGIPAVWVGDMKQSIYAFREADPGLMSAVIGALPEAYTGDTLGYSYRSRPSLVSFANALFKPTFEKVMPDVPVTLEAKREELPSGETAVHFWSFPYDRDFRTIGDYHAAVAAGIQELVERALPVEDEQDGERAVTYGDIAVLCRTRAHAQSISAALKAAHIPVVMERPGLLATPEGVFVSAAMRYLADPSDSLAVAEMRMIAYDEADVASLVTGRIELVNSGSEASWGSDSDVIASLDHLRTTLQELDISSVVDAVIARLEVPRMIGRFGDAEQVYVNLERVRSLVDEYTQSASRKSLGASLSGFVRFLDELAAEETDMQAHAAGLNAVQVLTYHGAKGLEWPVVVCMDLDTSFDAPQFRIEMRDGASGFSPYEPLAGRSIRFWPDPGTGTNSFLCSQIESSAIYEKRTSSEFAEDCRLLYVGFTRARDYLILPFQRKSKGEQRLSWLDAVYSEGRDRSLEIPEIEGEFDELFVDEHVPVPVKVVCRSRSDRAAVRPAAKHVSVVTANRGMREYPAYQFAASGAGAEAEGGQPDYTKEPAKYVSRVFDYAESVELPPVSDPSALGEAVHVILLLTIGRNAVLDEAEVEAILSYFGVTERSAASIFSKRAGAFLVWLNSTWPGASYDLETTGYTKENDILVSARIDLLVETDSEIVIIDHKTIVDVSDVQEAALGYTSQLSVYGKVVQMARGEKPIRTMVNLSVQGAVVEVE